ncbi:MAG: hypothetical protein K6G88_08320 [Lachnospiraceae bacterium]|nr:hypothetical protein [Lachnospiraceae bacterium]
MEKIKRSGNTTVDALAFNQISGYSIHPEWFRHIVKENKTDTLAVLMLGAIVYWYSPTFSQDNEIKKKFKGEAYQLNYSDYANAFGRSKKTITRAVDLLCDLGIIKKVIKNIKVGTRAVNNVVYIQINISKLLEISGIKKKEKKKNQKIETIKAKKRAELTKKQKEILLILKNKKHAIPDKLLKSVAKMLAYRNADEKYIDNLIARISIYTDKIKNYYTYIKKTIINDYVNDQLQIRKVYENTTRIELSTDRTYNYDTLEKALLNKAFCI